MSDPWQQRAISWVKYRVSCPAKPRISSMRRKYKSFWLGVSALTTAALRTLSKRWGHGAYTAHRNYRQGLKLSSYDLHEINSKATLKKA